MRDMVAIRNHYMDMLEKLSEAGLETFFETRARCEFLDFDCDLAPEGVFLNCGETKAVIYDNDFPYVLKIPFFTTRTVDKNYCDFEVDFYAMAEEAGLEDCFAWCDFLFFFHNCPIYIMEWADCSEDEIEDSSYDACFRWACAQEGVSEEKDPEEYDRFRDRFSDTFYNMDCDDRMIDLLDEVWGFEKARAFNDFCYDHHINDRHSGNWGYVDGRLVIIDYSGYFGI